MDSDKPADPRTIKTCDSIRLAFIHLIMERPANQINVKAITDEAGINRKTFYLHYECIEDLYAFVCDEISEGYAQLGNALNPKNSTKEDIDLAAERYYKTFYEYFASLKPYQEKIMCDPSYIRWSTRVKISCAASNRKNEKNMLDLTPNERMLFDTSFVGNMLAVYRRWVACGKTQTIDELVSYSMKILFHGMSALFYSE